MKNLKFGVLLFGILGVVSVFLPMISMGEMSASLWDAKSGAPLNVYGTLAGFALAAVMGVLGATKPPFTKMHAILATVGFVLPAVLATDMKPHKLFDGFSGAIGAKLLVISVLGGLVVSLISVAKSEEA